ncbi:uncharacterized protein A4U43_C04F31660 [Asparagus officinalis]|uniref:Uncharacterized protein n=1 Tax=Asparagus officinalis TaxID=4686 RepID=A0A5P1F5R8_ASPOF|nr:uncharacterized protein A4U43_C04F31660 [Asparagus officinalis]
MPEPGLHVGSDLLVLGLGHLWLNLIITYFSVEFLSREFSAHSVEGHCSEAYASTDEPIPVPVAPQFVPGVPEELPRLVRKGERHSLRQLITDAPLVKDPSSTHPLRKPDYLFGDSIEDPAVVFLGITTTVATYTFLRFLATVR